VTNLFAAADLVPAGVAPRGTPVPKTKPEHAMTLVLIAAADATERDR
jgi:hypothetical protein